MIQLPMLFTCLCLVLTVYAVHAGEAGEAGDYNLHLELTGLLPDTGSEKRPRKPTTIEIPYRGGQRSDPLRCRVLGYNTGHHRLRITEAGENDRNLTCALEIVPDLWRPGATGQLTIELDGDGGGSFEAELRFDDAEEAQQTSGPVTAERRPPWPEALSDHVPPAIGEHPRLVVRKSELPELRELAATPFGQAALARCTGHLDTPLDNLGQGKFASWPAAELGHAYLLSGDKRHAERAAAIIEHVFFAAAGARYRNAPSQDIHYAPLLLGLALAYDACHAAWDEDLRVRCAAEIAGRVRDLYRGASDGKKMSGLNLHPWSNHNAIRVGCLGVGALAVFDAPSLPAETRTELRLMADDAAAELRDYLRRGLGESGWCMEGYYYKHMTLRRGVMQFLRAWPLVMGGRIDGHGLGDFYLAGEFQSRSLTRARPHAENDCFWPGLWLTAREDLLPAYKHLAGDPEQTLRSGMAALYALVAYPHDLEAAAPGQLIPWFLPDRRKGFCVFRSLAPEREHIQVLAHQKTDILPACHYERAGKWPSLEVSAFDINWCNEDVRFLPAVRSRSQANNVLHGPRLIAIHRPVADAVVLDQDLSPTFLQILAKDASSLRVEAKQAGATERQIPPWDHLLYDYGITGRRSLLVDTSGACGSPLLLAWVDVLDGVPPMPEAENESQAKDLPPALRKMMAKKAKTKSASYLPLPLAPKTDLPRTIDGRRLTFGTTDGEHLSAWAVHPAEWGGDARLESDDNRYIVVITIQDGPAPTVDIDGDGLDATITIGDRILRYDSETIVVDTATP